MYEFTLSCCDLVESSLQVVCDLTPTLSVPAASASLMVHRLHEVVSELKKPWSVASRRI
jgi:hypothetical protein